MRLWNRFFQVFFLCLFHFWNLFIFYLFLKNGICLFCFWFWRRDSFITHRAFCDALAEENAKSQTQPVVKASSESDSKVLTGDSLPQPPPPSLPVVTTTAATTPQSNSGVSSALETQKLGKYFYWIRKKKWCFCLVWCG